MGWENGARGEKCLGGCGRRVQVGGGHGRAWEEGMGGGHGVG